MSATIQRTMPLRTLEIFDALLAGKYAAERAELRAAGVSAHQIERLYPTEIADVHGGLRAYVEAGKRINLAETFEEHTARADVERDLWTRLDFNQRTTIGNYINASWDARDRTEKLICAYKRVRFTPEKQMHGGSKEGQAGSLVNKLIWGLNYVRMLQSTTAETYLCGFVQTKLPELLEGGAA
jgi:hypothetical protein